MGVFKKMFGGGNMEPVKVDPAPVQVTSQDTEVDKDSAQKEKKKRQGISSTQSGVLTDNASDVKSTLG